MKRAATVGILLFLGAFVLFFFFAPVVGGSWVSCYSPGSGYASLSYHFFGFGETYFSGYSPYVVLNGTNSGPNVHFFRWHWSPVPHLFCF